MKKENKIPINDIYRDLIRQVHYDNPAEAFYTLWECFEQFCLRNNIHDYSHMHHCQKRGWISRKDAELFTNYINASLKWTCLE